MKVQFQVLDDGKIVLSVLSDGVTVDVPLDGVTKDGTPRIARLAEKLQKVADKAASGKSYRYALNV